MKVRPVQGSASVPAAPVFLARLRTRWRFVAYGATICGMAALAASFVLPRTYISDATVIVSPPAFQEAAKPPSESQTTSRGVGELLPPPLPVEACKAIALSPPLLVRVLDALKLEDTDTDDLQEQMDVELVQMGSRSVQTGVAYAPTLLFHVRAPEAGEAAALAQTWTRVFQEQMDEVARGNLDTAFGSLERLNARFQEDVRRSDDAIESHQKSWNVDLMKSEILSMQSLLTDLNAQLTRLDIELAGAESRQRALAEELSREPQKLVYFRAPSDDVYWLTGVEGLAPERGLRTEEPNANYTAARAALVTVLQQTSGLRAERDTTLVKVEEIGSKLEELVAAWSEQNAVRERLLREQESLRVNYGLVRSEYEKGRMALQTLSSHIVLCGAATTPKSPTGPGRAAVTLIAAVAGALLAAGALALKPATTEVIALTAAEPENSSKRTTRRPAARAAKNDDAAEV